eukprot:11851982-Ditylum_brightwellii.AAC.1
MSMTSSVSKNDTKMLIAEANKLLEGKTISYPQQSSKAKMNSSLFFIMQQQMKQREDEKASREQQMLIVYMECKATERVCKKHEIQSERCHQYFMMMMMMVVTGTKSPASSPSSFTLLHVVTPTKGAATTGSITTFNTELTAQTKEDTLEKQIAVEMVLHDTVMHMQTPLPPEPTMSESEKAQINKIRETKNYLKRTIDVEISFI